MGKPKKILLKAEEWVEKRATAIWTNLQTNHLWQRMLKNTLATTIAIILALTPAVVAKYGKAAYLGPVTTVFGHPGRRFGMMAEALVLAVGGTLFGMAWSVFGVYLSSLVYSANPPAAYTIRGIFLACALMLHGFLRSHTPRLFLFVLLMIIVSVVSLTGVSTAVTKTLVTQLLYPILTAVGILLIVNTTVFPEFSSSFLGTTTIETLGETVGALRDAGKYFISTAEASEQEEDALGTDGSTDEHNGFALTQTMTMAERPPEKPDASPSVIRKMLAKLHRTKEDDTEPPAPKVDTTPATVKLKTLTDKKAKLRTKLASCKAAQTECNFEISFAVLPPRDLKPISDTDMKALVANTIALIGACESKYALMGDVDDKKEDESKDEAQLEKLAEDIISESGDDFSRPNSEVDESHDDSANEKREARRSKREKRRLKKKKEKQRKSLESEIEDLELVKPRKEIEFGDVELLKYLVNRIAKPLADLQEKIDRSVDVVTSCLAYCYDVQKLPNGSRPPKGIELEEIDIRVDILSNALTDFDKNSALALEGAAALHDLEAPEIDIMPRMETFLISSFLLNLRQAALHTLEMLRHSRVIVEKRQARHERRRLYAPRINWRKWLTSGGEEDMLALPVSARKDARTGTAKDDPTESDPKDASNDNLLGRKDVETGPRNESPPAPRKTGNKPEPVTVENKAKNGDLFHRLRNGLADSIEYLAGSDDVLYAIKLTIAVFLVTWPAFVHRWNTWYSLNRGLWAALQLVLITEVAIGTSVSVFMLRGVGTTLGCIWGYAAYEAGNGNRVIAVVMLVIGIIPSTYIQLGSKYIKAGMVSIISMSVVTLATVDKTVPGTATENFLKRLIAFLIGGVVALIVEVVLFPVKARDRLVESLAACIRQISEMEGCLAYGIEQEINVDVHSKAVTERFARAKGKAEGALAAAETFLPFCANEPRLKGSFKGLALVYAEILYVLHAIVDKMDNMLHLRQEYGSGVLEELNTQVYQYRRNVAGSITLILFAVHEALTTKLPLPQFLPSARLAHLRMVNRVREVILERAPGAGDDGHEAHHESLRASMGITMVKRIVRQKYLSWNAASAGQVEVIEYLEELIDLTKLLVGANEFRSGLLTRPTYREYVDRVDPLHQPEDVAPGADIEKDDEQDELRDTMPEPDSEARKLGLTRRRTTFGRKKEDGFEKKKSPGEKDEAELERQRLVDEDELPRSLQRVRTRRMSWVQEETNRLEKSKSATILEEQARRRAGKKVDKSQ